MATKAKKRQFYCEQNRQAFNRWRDHTMKQMTAASTVFFGLSSAGLGYVLALLNDNTKPLAAAYSLPFRVFAWAFAVSFIAGIFLVINRLEDFRRTADIVKNRDENTEARDSDKPIPHPDLDDRREQTGLLGGLTWILFYTQLVGIGVGGGAFLWFIWSLYGSKLTT
jgi:hypothetical protein